MARASPRKGARWSSWTWWPSMSKAQMVGTLRWHAGGGLCGQAPGGPVHTLSCVVLVVQLVYVQLGGVEYLAFQPSLQAPLLKPHPPRQIWVSVSKLEAEPLALVQLQSLT